MRKTKIICTLGPSTEGIIEELIENGMDAARLNFSHGDHKTHLRAVTEIKTAREKTGRPIPIIIDIKGPKMRIGEMKGKVSLVKGDLFTLAYEDIFGDQNKVSVSNKELYKCLHPGNSIYINDGRIALEVKMVEDTDIVCRVVSGGIISSKKGVNAPDCVTGAPYVSDSDINDIRFALDNGFDFIALSFVKDAADIFQIRQFLHDSDRPDVKIIAKIENRAAVRNIDEIISASDCIMVARGDLGVELPVAQVPLIQKEIIHKCHMKAKPVIIATHMLESMTDDPLPTRAEVSDISNAVFDGAGVTMLSGETAAGEYPVRALQMMAEIIRTTERSIDFKKKFSTDVFTSDDKKIPDIISKASVLASFEADTDALIVPTRSGKTARIISSLMPACRIIALTADPVVQRQLNMSWGVNPLLMTDTSSQDLFTGSIELAMKAGLIKNGDLVIITYGSPAGNKSITNLLKLHRVGEEQ